MNLLFFVKLVTEKAEVFLNVFYFYTNCKI